jgi:hypothetical protein
VYSYRRSQKLLWSSHLLLRSSHLLLRSSHLLFRSSQLLFRSSHLLFRSSQLLFRSSHLLFRSSHLLLLSAYLLKLRGSSASRKPSPSKLNANTVRIIKIAGGQINQGCNTKIEALLARESILPQEGSGC